MGKRLFLKKAYQVSVARGYRDRVKREALFCANSTKTKLHFLCLNQIAQNTNGKVKLISKTIEIIDEVSNASYDDFNARGMACSDIKISLKTREHKNFLQKKAGKV